MVPVQKSNGKLRICVDLRKLNSAVTRARFVLPTLEDVAPKLAGARYFSKLYASSGFWQIPLHPESAKLTTFITPFRRFCFKRLPFGITCAPEIFQGLMTDFFFTIQTLTLLMLLTMPYYSYITNNTNTYTTNVTYNAIPFLHYEQYKQY